MCFAFSFRLTRKARKSEKSQTIIQFIKTAETLIFESDTKKDWDTFLKDDIFKDEKVALMTLDISREKNKKYKIFETDEFFELEKGKTELTLEEIRFIILYRVATINWHHVNTEYLNWPVNVLLRAKNEYTKDLFRSMLKEPIWLSCLESAYEKLKIERADKLGKNNNDKSSTDYQYRHLFRVIFNRFSFDPFFNVFKYDDVYRPMFKGKIKIPLCEYLPESFSFSDNSQDNGQDKEDSQYSQFFFPGFFENSTELYFCTLKQSYLLGRYVEVCDHLKEEFEEEKGEKKKKEKKEPFYRRRKIEDIMKSFNRGRAELMKEKKENILLLEKFLNSFQPNFLLPEINSIIVRF
jgi:hypothetical protein